METEMNPIETIGSEETVEQLRERLAEVNARASAAQQVSAHTAAAAAAANNALAAELAAVKLVVDAKAPTGFKIAMPQNFLGTATPKVEEWGFKVENAILLTGVAPAGQLRFALQFIGGAAFNWWKSVEDVAAAEAWTWPVFLTHLKTAFSPVDDRRTAYGQLTRLRQSNRSAAAYCQEYREVAVRTPMLEANSVHNFVDGLRPDIRLNVGLQHPATLEKAMELSQMADAFLCDSGRSAGPAAYPDHCDSGRSAGPATYPDQDPDAGTDVPAPMELGALARRGCG